MPPASPVPPGRRRFAIATALATLFLIFVGSLVTSTGSALAVPDWPLAYGMLFPPMVGGVFYEHGHRLVASLVGLMTVVLAFWLQATEPRAWVRKCGWLALGAVVAQGLLGGLTVLFMQKQPIPIVHGILAQTFFMLTILIAYSQVVGPEAAIAAPTHLRRISVASTAAIYIQLILGAVMRHTKSGLAVPDFPTMAGSLFPTFDAAMLRRIAAMRFDANIDPTDVTMAQVAIHLAHRAGAAIVAACVLALAFAAARLSPARAAFRREAIFLAALLAVQIMLGAFTIWSLRQPFVASFHVLTGAAMLGISTLLTLRTFPIEVARPVKRAEPSVDALAGVRA